jgi:tetratricopeptide (TPR) repeat protein
MLTYDYYGRHALAGRASELEQLCNRLLEDQDGVIALVGDSGIGKTALADAAADMASRRYFQVTFRLSLYRTTWVAALSRMRKELTPQVPMNATYAEQEAALLLHFKNVKSLLILDNVDQFNTAEVSAFINLWRANYHGSKILLTAQPGVLSDELLGNAKMAVTGITDDDAVSQLFGPLAQRFERSILLRVADVVGRSPQFMLMLRWLAPRSQEALDNHARRLAEASEIPALDQVLDAAGIPSLFFLSLGIRRDLRVDEGLLSALWDRFGARGTEAYIACREKLITAGLLSRGDSPTEYRLHEIVQTRMYKALVHRVGADRIPSFHYYLSEYYRTLLSRTPSVDLLAEFVEHSFEANDFKSALEVGMKPGVLPRVAESGTALRLRETLARFHGHSRARAAIGPEGVVRVLVQMGRLSNDLSEHDNCLRLMEESRGLIESIEDVRTRAALSREGLYCSAVAFSNLGLSDQCVRSYLEIVLSSAQLEDARGCVSLGYLAHDLKYRDLATAIILGELAVDWARAFESGDTLAKNLCSLAESYALNRDFPRARSAFGEAKNIAQVYHNRRELGRISTNEGFAHLLCGETDLGEALLHCGRELSAGIGDRRRTSQAEVYLGVARAQAGDVKKAIRHFAEAASTLASLRDGRAFVPALLWLLQQHGIGVSSHEAVCRLPKADTPVPLELLEYAVARPELAIYHTFWINHCADVGRCRRA